MKNVRFTLILVVFTLIGIAVPLIWFKSHPQSLRSILFREQPPVSKGITIEVFSDPVFVATSSKEKIQQAKNGQAVDEGYVISTGEEGRAQIVYPNGTVTRLDRNTTIVLNRASQSPMHVEVVIMQGQIWSRIAKLAPDQQYKTYSRKITTSVRGTSYGHTVEDAQNVDEVITTKGAVVGECFNSTEDGLITENQKKIFTCEKKEDETSVPIPESDKSQEWYIFNDVQDVALEKRFGAQRYEEKNILGIFDDKNGTITERSSRLLRNIFNRNTAETISATPTPVSTNTSSSGTGKENNVGSTTTPSPVATTAPVIEEPEAKIIAKLIVRDGASVEIYNPQTKKTTTYTGNGSTVEAQVAANSTIETKTGRAEVQFSNGTVTRMDASTKIRLNGSFDSSFQANIGLDFGRIWNRVKNLTGKDDSYKTETNTMVATVRGTAYGHEIKQEQGVMVDKIVTVEGRVFGQCKGSEKEEQVEITKNEKATFKCNDGFVDDYKNFLDNLRNLPEEEAEWILYNTSMDLPSQINDNRPPEITIATPEGGIRQELPLKLPVHAQVEDDGLPFGMPGLLWQVVTDETCLDINENEVSCVEFSHPNDTDTYVTFKKAGTYALQLTASDIVSSTTESIIMVVTGENNAPVVNAGSDQEIMLPGIAELSASVDDDNKPLATLSGGTWELLDGPIQDITFSNQEGPATNVTFLQEGIYTFRYRVFDGEKWGQDTVQVSVSADIDNKAPKVTASEDVVLTLSGNSVSASLSALIEDDGYINNTPSISWKQKKGPISCNNAIENNKKCVNFEAADQATTSATFYTDGEYELQITVHDGELQDTDSVKVIVEKEKPTPTQIPTPTPTIEVIHSPTPSLTPSPTPTINYGPKPVMKSLTRWYMQCNPIGATPCDTFLRLDGKNLKQVKDAFATSDGVNGYRPSIITRSDTSVYFVFTQIPGKRFYLLRVQFVDGSETYAPAAFGTW